MHYFSCFSGTSTGLTKKQFRTRYAELVFLHPVGSEGDVVHSGVSGRETSMHNFSCSGGTGMDSTKIVLGYIMLNF
jgi:hypothetical protein